MYEPRHVSEHLSLFSNAAAVRIPAFEVIHRMQGKHPAIQLLATAVALKAMTDAAGVDLSDLLHMAGRVITDAEGPFTAHIQAIRDYAAGELRRSP